MASRGERLEFFAKQVLGHALASMEMPRVRGDKSGWVYQGAWQADSAKQKERYTHSYPFCWRCKTPLLYYAMRSWFIKMSALRKKLVAHNRTINWVPRHMKEGRFGEWLREVKDWNFSRNRYWGTPLPVWKCAACGNCEVIGSREDLLNQNFSANTFYLLRHGEAEKNVAHIISSRMPEKRKFKLTKRGREQAEVIAKSLAKR